MSQEIRVIEKDATGLPRNFAVIESASEAEAMRDMLIAFQNPDVALVVWNKPENLIDPAIIPHAQALESLRMKFERTSPIETGTRRLLRSLGFKRYDWRDSLSNHFSEVAGCLHLKQDSLRPIVARTSRFIEAAMDVLKPSFLSTEFRLRKQPLFRFNHLDGVLRSHEVVALMVDADDKTVYYDEKDVTIRPRFDKSFQNIETVYI